MWKIIIFSMAILMPATASAQQICSKKEVIAAETEAATLNSWKALYGSYKRYCHCDDGAIAEGYSWSVMKLLTEKWDDLGSLMALFGETEFMSFVLGHIDATYAADELETIILNSTRICPNGSKDLCQKISAAAKAALKNLRAK